MRSAPVPCLLAWSTGWERSPSRRRRRCWLSVCPAGRPLPEAPTEHPPRHSSVGGLWPPGRPPTRLLVVYTPTAWPEMLALSIERLLNRATAALVAVVGERGAPGRYPPTGRYRKGSRSFPTASDLGRPALISWDLRSPLGMIAPGTPLKGTGRTPRAQRTIHQIEPLPETSAVLDRLDVFVLPSLFEGGPYTPWRQVRRGVHIVPSDLDGTVTRSGAECFRRHGQHGPSGNRSPRRSTPTSEDRGRNGASQGTFRPADHGCLPH